MCHVLIIEDEWLEAGHLGELAVGAGATSLAFAPTENAAIAAANDVRPAVIFSDVRLREGTGPTAVKAIIGSLGPIPVIYITGSPEECEAADYVVAVLTKPAQPIEIHSIFAQVAP